MEDMMGNPFNHYCLSCKTQYSTHAILWLGAYCCVDCAKKVSDKSNGYAECYIKSIFNEQWDDYQLRSVALGGNQAVFDIMREYNLETKPLHEVINHAALKWFRKYHIAMMDGVMFNMDKPTKTWKETFSRAQSSFVKSLENNFENIYEQHIQA